MEMLTPVSILKKTRGNEAMNENGREGVLMMEKKVVNVSNQESDSEDNAPCLDAEDMNSKKSGSPSSSSINLVPAPGKCSVICS